MSSGNAGPVVTAAGPVGTAERALTPDLARGLALLGIALANSVVQLFGRPVGPGSRLTGGSTADQTVDVLVTLLVDNRAICLFSLLFGYGVVIMLRRQEASGAPFSRAATVLSRRNAGLITLGFFHAWLLFEGDILTSWGVLGFILLLLVRLRTDVLWWVTGALALALAGLASYDGATASATGPPIMSSLDGPFEAMGMRLLGWGAAAVVTPLFAAGLLAPMVIGVILARMRVLDEPAAHLPLLRKLTLVGIPVSVLGAVPFAIAVGRGQTSLFGAEAWVWASLQGLTGLAGGVGYVAAVAWWVAWRSVRTSTPAPPAPPARPAWPVRAIAATGERSASAYLAQSLLFVPILAPWGIGLGGRIGSAGVAALAIGVWVVTVLMSWALAGLGVRGPAETFLRRVTYGRR